ncbi:MAG: hypothetical protein LH614_17085 [Pyrinomonadaceae bacterium]|nr:hypothetical protein [Pyrinomonadaceae bacterium]
MNKNHSQKLSEEKLDRFAQAVLQSTVLTDEEVEQIAGAPRLWRQLQSRIADEKARRAKRRFFVWNWQWATAGAFAVLLTASAAVWFFNVSKAEIAVVREEKSFAVPNDEINPPEIKKAAPIQSTPTVQRKVSTVKAAKKSSSPIIKSKSFRSPLTARNLPSKKIENSRKSEIATDFIALSFLPATESGQIVRVKVPRSMLVSLGVTTRVEKNSELVNAEIILSDDGAARAIRFLAND